MSFWRTWLICSGLAFLMPLITDIYLPAIPSIAAFYDVEAEEIQMTLATMNLGAAIGQIIFGPLADRYGRKPILLIAMLVFTVCSFVAIEAPNVEWHSLLRFLQGISCASGMIICRAIVRDLFDGPKAAKLLAYVFVSGSTMPILAPIVGGNITTYFGWKPTFFVMGFIGLLIVLSILLLMQETGRKDFQALNIGIIIKSFSKLTKSKIFVIYTLIGMGPFAGLFSILTVLSTILIKYMGVTPTTFGYLFAGIMIGNLLASLLAGKLVSRLGNHRLIYIGSTVCFLSGTASGLISILGYATPIYIVIPSAFFMIGFALTIPPATAGAMSPFPEIAGRASSLIGLVHFGTAAVASFMVSKLSDGSEITLGVALSLSGVICMISILPLSKLKD